MPKITAEEMQKLFKIIASDLGDAKLFLMYYKDISQCLQESPRIIGYGQTFWLSTLEAYRQCMAKCLWLAYEQRASDSTGLPHLLQCIRENIHLFPEEKRMEVLEQCRQDRKIVMQKFNKKVKLLISIRHKNGFHRDANIALGKKTDIKKINETKLSLEELDELIDIGINILNHYSSQFNGIFYSNKMLGYGDHKAIFEIINKHDITEQRNLLKLTENTQARE